MTDAIEARLERALDTTMDVTSLTDSDDSIYIVDNENGGVHTVIPAQLHCSCEDHIYRSEICKHLIYITIEMNTEQVPEEARTQTRNALTDRLTELQEEEIAIRAQLREIVDERDGIEKIRATMEMRDYGLQENVNDDGTIEEGSKLEDLVTDMLGDRQ